MHSASNVHPTQHLVDALVAARDSARVRLHLLSLDARNDWYELESQLDCLQSRIEYSGVHLRPGAAEKVSELTETITEFLREHANPDALLASCH